ncbi:MAG: cation:proton antiporter [Polyangiaceae bacterium]|nr:cation:proton antiporter [Polyangiaceae bacterium]
MSSTALLVVLLALAYIGSLVVGSRGQRGYGLTSGVEYLLVGVALGPHLLGLVDRDLARGFGPLAVVGLGWVGFGAGLEYGMSGRRRITARGAVVGVALGLVGVAFVGAAVWLSLLWLAGLGLATPPAREALLLAGGVGAVGAETARHVIRAVVERDRAEGRLTNLLADLAAADDVIPVLALTALYAFAPAGAADGLSLATRIGLELGLGVLLGLLLAALLGREPRLAESWGLLLGTCLLALGVASRLELSALAVAFFFGLSLAIGSRHRDDLRDMVTPTEQPVVLPLLLLAGASIDVRAAPYLVPAIAVGIVARVVVKLLAGAGVLLVSLRARAAGLRVGLGLLPSGAFGVAIGMSCYVALPGGVGETILAFSALSCVVGELLGPPAVRRTLVAAGEIAGAPPAASPPGRAEPPAAVTPEGGA